MGWTGIWQWVVVLVIVLILFGGRGKVSALMGDFGKGLKAFKKNVTDGEDTEADAEAPKALKSESAATVESAVDRDNAAKN